jgi:hypothetical protein
MKSIFLKNVALTIFLILAFAIVSNAQGASSSGTIGTTMNTKTSEAWQWANRIGLLMIMVVTMIGTIVTYGKKNSDQPGEFKRYVIGFGSGVAFLVIALSLMNIIKSLFNSAVGTTL